MTNDYAAEALRRLANQTSARIPDEPATDKQVATLLRMLNADRFNAQATEAFRAQIEARGDNGKRLLTRREAVRLLNLFKAAGPFRKPQFSFTVRG